MEKNGQNIRENDEGMKCNSKIENNGEIKRQKGRGKVEESVTIGLN